MFALAAYILKMNKNNMKISMASEKGRYSNLWRVSYLKKERKSHVGTRYDSMFINFSERQKSEIKENCLDVSEKCWYVVAALKWKLEGFLWQWGLCSVGMGLMPVSKEGSVHSHTYMCRYTNTRTANESGAGLWVVLASYVVLPYGTLEKVRGPFFTSPFLVIP